MRKTENPKTHCYVDDTFMTKEEIHNLFERFGSPLFVYNEQRLRNRAKSLLSLFSSCKGQYFSLRHCCLPDILRIMQQEGIGAQCHSEEELDIALNAGFSGENILYCAMTLSEALAQRLQQLNVTLVAGSPLALEHALPTRVRLICRLPKKRNCLGASEMERSGVGFMPDELPPEMKHLQEKGVESIGLSLHYDGNVTDEQLLAQRLQALHNLAQRLHSQGFCVDGIHIDGYLGTQYNRVKLHPLNEEAAAAAVCENLNLNGEKLTLSLSNFLLEPCAIFLTTIVDVWKRSCPVILMDVRFSMLHLKAVERYHHMSILERTWIEDRTVCDVYGNMAVAGEWFAKNRVLPLPEKGEHLIIHDVGCSANIHCGVPLLLRRADGSICSLQNGKE